MDYGGDAKGFCRGFIWIMEKKMETAIQGSFELRILRSLVVKADTAFSQGSWKRIWELLSTV